MRSLIMRRFCLPALLVLAGCMEGPISGIDAANTPAVGSQRNSFAFSVLARACDLDQTYPLTFDSDSASVGVAVTGYRGGSGTLEVLDAAGQLVFSWSLAGNVAEGTTAPLTARPATARVHLTGYTGTVAIGVHGR